jgi:hypothetical protein
MVQSLPLVQESSDSVTRIAPRTGRQGKLARVAEPGQANPRYDMW